VGDIGVTVAADPAERALDRLGDSAAVARARAAMATLLEGVRSSCWPDIAWRFSRLTAPGCPVELSFCSAEPAFRYTVEVAGPEVDPAERLPLAERLLAAVAPGSSLPSPLRAELNELQAAGALAWGAWIGARHDARGSRYKLYAEVPRDAGAAAARMTEAHLGDASLLAQRHPRFEGVGYEPATGQLELYYRLDGLDVWETGTLLVHAGLGGRQSDLLELMEDVYGRPMRPHLPRHQFGASFTLAASGQPAAITLFSYAVDVFGTDARARRALVTRLGLAGDDYARVSEPLADVETLPTHHTVVAFTALAQGAPALTVGLVPP